MRILQLGNNNWANQYSLSEDLEWHFNDFPEKLKVNPVFYNFHLRVLPLPQ